ncbi:MAG: M23 family metallopeptidase [Chloroflexota bacterium]
MAFRLLYPCDRHIPVTQYFMANPNIYSRFGLPGHDGIDWGTPINSPIYAPADGTVQTAGFQANGYGNFIRLGHVHADGTFLTLMAHLNRVLVNQNQTVRVGDIIGYSGNTGFSTGPHLHFSLQWSGATTRGFTTYRGFGRQATFPRDFVDPAPYLVPPLNSPAQPTNPNHPSLHFENVAVAMAASGNAGSTDAGSVAVASGTVDGTLGMRVQNTAQFGGLAIRPQPDTTGTNPPRVPDGTTLLVKATPNDIGGIRWRQIIEPEEHRNKWTAELVNNTQYLIQIPVSEVTGASETVTVDNPREAEVNNPTTLPQAEEPTMSTSRPTPDAVGVRVTNTASAGGLKVRAQPNTQGLTLTRLQDGMTLWAKPILRDGGAIQWRQILSPAEYRNMWVAQSFNQTQYLQQVADTDVASSDTETAPTVVVSEPVSTSSAPTTASTQAGTSGERMVIINTGTLQLKVRSAPNTTGEIAGKLADGSIVRVAAEQIADGNLTWRKLVEPVQFADNYVAESFATTRYLIPAPADAGGDVVTAPSAQSAPAAETPSTAAAAPAPAPAPVFSLTTSDPAPLTGRFTLVDRGLYTKLAIDGDDSTRMGVNIRELAYFGTPQWQWTQENQRKDFLKEAKNIGKTWVRFYAPHREYTPAQIVDRTRRTLDDIQAAGMLGIVVLGDSLAETNLYPPGDESYHTEVMGHINKGYWHNKSYETNYIPLLQRIVGELKDHPAVGMWQLMNEPAIYPQPASQADADAFAAFVDRASSLIYDIDTAHPISMGIINVAHVAPSAANQLEYPREYLAARKYIHVVSCHCYQHLDNGDPNVLWDQEDRANIDGPAAAATERAFMLTEFGASQAGDRTASSEAFLRRQLQGNNASAALQWGFMPTSNDVGVGDSHFGLSRANITQEYDQLGGLFSQIRNRIHLV